MLLLCPIIVVYETILPTRWRFPPKERLESGQARHIALPIASQMFLGGLCREPNFGFRLDRTIGSEFLVILILLFSVAIKLGGIF